MAHSTGAELPERSGRARGHFINVAVDLHAAGPSVRDEGSITDRMSVSRNEASPSEVCFRPALHEAMDVKCAGEPVRGEGGWGYSAAMLPRLGFYSLNVS